MQILPSLLPPPPFPFPSPLLLPFPQVPLLSHAPLPLLALTSSLSCPIHPLSPYPTLSHLPTSFLCCCFTFPCTTFTQGVHYVIHPITLYTFTLVSVLPTNYITSFLWQFYISNYLIIIFIFIFIIPVIRAAPPGRRGRLPWVEEPCARVLWDMGKQTCPFFPPSIYYIV